MKAALLVVCLVLSFAALALASPPRSETEARSCEWTSKVKAGACSSNQTFVGGLSRNARRRSGPSTSVKDLVVGTCHLHCDCQLCQPPTGPNCGGELEMCVACWSFLDSTGVCDLEN